MTPGERERPSGLGRASCGSLSLLEPCAHQEHLAEAGGALSCPARRKNSLSFLWISNSLGLKGSHESCCPGAPRCRSHHKGNVGGKWGGTILLSVKYQLCARFDLNRAGEGKLSGSVGLHLGILAQPTLGSSLGLALVRRARL